jgi:hypothetical protein
MSGTQLSPFARSTGWVCLALAVALPLCGQTPGAALNETNAAAGGVADVAIQGYYFGGSGQAASILNGADVGVREFVPGVGMLTGNLEGYQENTRGRLGENFIQLRGYMWEGRRWNFLVGDFRLPSTIVTFPFLNYFNPQISARGVSIEMADGSRTWTLFGGEETLSAGPRITFRLAAPQTVAGLMVKQKIGALELGVRFMHTDSPNSAPLSNAVFFPTGHEFHTTDTLLMSQYYAVSKRLKLYSDETLSHRVMDAGFAVPPNAPLSFLAGVAWDTVRFTAKANYGSQTTDFFPVLGVFAGDRRGPYGEAHYKPVHWIDLTANAGQTRNNLENNGAVPTLDSYTWSAGGTVFLPGQFTVSGLYSLLNFTSQQLSDPTQDQVSKNTEKTLTLTRPVGKHQLRLTASELNLASTFANEKVSAAELEDGLHFSRLSATVAVRFQQANTGQVGNTIFFRGNAQLHLGSFTIYGQAEIGNDFVNQSVFSTNTVRTELVGVSLAGFKGWTLQAEAFRNSLNTVLNGESEFLLAAQGTGVSTVLADLNQWNAYLRLSRRLQWGAGLPETGGQFNYDQEPIYGTVEGFVRLRPEDGLSGVPEIAVALDSSRTTTTDVSGRYRFDEVIQGAHEVSLSMDTLPAEYGPGEHAKSPVAVKPRKASRADLDVARIGSTITGRVNGGEAVTKNEVLLDRVVVILNPGDHETTCDAKGNFAFYNLEAGDYKVKLDTSTLPELHISTSSPEISVHVDMGEQAEPLEFVIEKHEPQLPVRKVFGGQASLVP